MKPVQQWRYRLNPKYAVNVKEEINKLLQVGFSDGVLDSVAGHEIYSFLDGFSAYNQVRINLVD